MTRAAPVHEPILGAPTRAGETGTYGANDQIRLTGVAGIGHHGVLEEERRDGQPFLADLVLTVDTRAAAADDDLTRTVNYAEVAQQVVAVIEGEPANLIETLAARIAAVALRHEGVQQASVTVHKPEAPVGVPFTDVEVTITRTPADDLPEVDLGSAEQSAAPAPLPPLPPTVLPPAAAATPEPVSDEPESSAAGADLHAEPEQPVPVVIALGGNVGDVRTTLRAVVADLRAMPGLSVEEVSPLARTAAVLAPDAVAQPDYLNAVVLATTAMAPMALLESMQGLENAYGRRRAERWGERTLDLDLIVYDGVSSTDPELSLPHPRASERAFVLVPWAQVAPDAFLPGLGGGPVATLAETAPDRGGVRWLALDWLEDPARPAPAPEPSPAPDPAAPAPAADSDPAVPAPAADSAAAAPPPVVAPEGAPAAPAPRVAPQAAVAAPAPVPESAPAAPAPDGASTAAAAEVDDAEQDWPENDAEQPVDNASAQPVPPAAGEERVSQWAPQRPEDLEHQESRESQDDLELLAHGDPDPEPPPPVLPPAGRPARASFPPPQAPAPAASAPAPVSAPDAGPWGEPGAAEPDRAPQPAPEPQAHPEPEPEPEDEPQAENDPEDGPGSWFEQSAARAEADQRRQSSLPWVTSPEEGQAPRLAPKWQPLRRHDDT
ncbi:2-amino-4-hydroxy-6-hydroxymethyldihydropteridine diphosphokinase [Ruania zhangjianzhongii]|uniref:2-amino-4-hydroxy-6- hydroxymethyldihydropteridine diphosphokinase n=1 Tax=Ruania zhangjianzhongii TaxID=2603206 RepID=UPI00143DBC26|nr:2-amino-4-hydroxy-6-hydroxymethyldihydropteridine diphosphokinase [Ruania zhangjianzhongii]